MLSIIHNFKQHQLCIIICIMFALAFVLHIHLCTTHIIVVKSVIVYGNAMYASRCLQPVVSWNTSAAVGDPAYKWGNNRRHSIV